MISGCSRAASIAIRLWISRLSVKLRIISFYRPHALHQFVNKQQVDFHTFALFVLIN